MLVCRCF